MRFLFCFILALLPTLTISANPIPISFTFQDGSESEVEFSASSGGSSSAVASYTGNTEALLHFAEGGVTVEGIEFTGGQTSVTDVDLSFGTRINSRRRRRDLDISYRTFSLTAEDGSYQVGSISADGVLENAAHFTKIDGGTQRVTISIPRDGEEFVSSNFFTTSPVTEPFSDTFTLSSEIVSETASLRVTEFTLTREIDSSETSEVDELGFTLTIRETGTLTLKGRIETDIRPPAFVGTPSSSAQANSFFSTRFELERASGGVELVSGPDGLELDEDGRRMTMSDVPFGQSTARLKLKNNFGETFVDFTINAYSYLEKPSSSTVGSDEFGDALAATSRWLLVGDPDRYSSKVHIYDASRRKLRRTITSDYNFGQAIAVSEDLALIGAPNRYSFEGAAHVYQISTGRELFELRGSDAGREHRFGSSVAISGNYAIVGAYGSRRFKGSVYVFDIESGEELVKLTPEEDKNRRFGLQLAVHGTTLIVSDTKAVHAFDLETFEQIGTFHEFTETGIFSEGDFSLAMTGGTAYVGDSHSEGGTVAAYDTETWERSHSFTLPESEDYSSLGLSLQVHGNFLAASSYGTRLSDLSTSDSSYGAGSVHFFNLETRELFNTVTLRNLPSRRLGHSLAGSEDSFFISSKEVRSSATHPTNHVFSFKVGHGLELDGFDQALEQLTHSDRFNPNEPAADPLGRGIPTGLAYGLGIPLEGALRPEHRAQLPRAVEVGENNSGRGLSFVYSREAPRDATLRVLRHTDLAAPKDSWTLIAIKAPDNRWRGSAQVEKSSLGLLQKVDVIDPEPSERAFYRLEVEISD